MCVCKEGVGGGQSHDSGLPLLQDKLKSGGASPTHLPPWLGLGVGHPEGAYDFVGRRSGRSRNVFAFPG